MTFLQPFVEYLVSTVMVYNNSNNSHNSMASVQGIRVAPTVAGRLLHVALVVLLFALGLIALSSGSLFVFAAITPRFEGWEKMREMPDPSEPTIILPKKKPHYLK